MKYSAIAIPDQRVPVASSPLFQHLLVAYASETNKTAAVWRMFTDADFAWRPHPRSSTVHEILKHQLLSERRFFGEFLGSTEPPAPNVLPSAETIDAYVQRLVELVTARLSWLGTLGEKDWLETVEFFDVRRERIWVFWRRILHSAHHRTQLAVYLRLLDRPVPAIYGPTADVTWSGADPTLSVEAADRR